jgi:hypothetical protein
LAAIEERSFVAVLLRMTAKGEWYVSENVEAEPAQGDGVGSIDDVAPTA